MQKWQKKKLCVKKALERPSVRNIDEYHRLSRKSDPSECPSDSSLRKQSRRRKEIFIRARENSPRRYSFRDMERKSRFGRMRVARTAEEVSEVHFAEKRVLRILNLTHQHFRIC